MNQCLLSRLVAAALMLLGCAFAAAQQQDKAQSQQAQSGNQKIDPLALRVLKAATDRIRNAKAYSFHALISRENLGTNDQVITRFSTSEVTVQQPAKLYVNSRGQGRDVRLIFNSGESILYNPETKLYTTFLSAGTIDSTLESLERQNLFLPTSNFLHSDPYASLTKTLTEAYVIGRVDLAGETVHQLAFMEPQAEWQLWVTGGPEPTIRRLEVINKEAQYRPRIVVVFSDWSFNISPDPALFTFSFAGATKIGTLKEAEKKP